MRHAARFVRCPLVALASSANLNECVIASRNELVDISCIFAFVGVHVVTHTARTCQASSPSGLVVFFSAKLQRYIYRLMHIG